MERKEISGFRGFEINKKGEVFTKSGQLIEPIVVDGDLWVELKDDGIIWRVKELVYTTFLVDVKEGAEVVLIDGNKKNVRVGNLAVMTPDKKRIHEAYLNRIKQERGAIPNSGVMGLPDNYKQAEEEYVNLKGCTPKQLANHLLDLRLKKMQKEQKSPIIGMDLVDLQLLENL